MNESPTARVRSRALGVLLVLVLVPGLAYPQPASMSQAERSLRETLRLRPTQASAHRDLGVLLAQRGDWPGALRSLRRAAVLDSKLEGVQRELGAVYLALDLLPRADSALRRALAQDPGDAGASMLKGLHDQRTGDHTAALERFRDAARLDASMADESAFNSAVSYYRLGDAPAARRALGSALDSEDGAIRERAASLQALLDETPGQEKRWSVRVAAGAFYDDNVTVSSVDQVTEIGDAGLTLDLSAAYVAWRGEASAVELSYDLSQTVYEDLSELNLQSHDLGVLFEHEWNGLDLSLGYGYSFTFLGGDDFLGSHTLRPTIGRGFGDRVYGTLGYTYTADNFIDDSDRDASTHGVGVQGFYVFDRGRGYLSAGVRLEDEHTEGREFEYVGLTYDLGLRVPVDALPLDPVLRVSYQFQDRDYDNVTPSIGVPRRDDRHTVTVALEAALDSWLLGRLEYERIDARSNLPSSDFEENIVGFSLEARY